MMNKPLGYEVTRSRRHACKRVYNLLPEDTPPSVQPVGRLDRDSCGLLLFTNDGELAYRLTHPGYGCPKTYLVQVKGRIDPREIERLRSGIELEDGPARPLCVDTVSGQRPAVRCLKMVMGEGRKRIVRRMCAAVGHPVVSLQRIAQGPIRLGALPEGETRTLSQEEVEALRRTVAKASPEDEQGDHNTPSVI
jgi:pseudouridine synthase